MLKTIRATLIMIGECFRMSLNNIRGAKVRSFLTVLGILIGVMAVITLITTVNGVTGSISESFFSMGAGTLTVSVTGSDLKTGMSKTDLEEIAALPEVEGVTPTVNINNARVSRGGTYQNRISVGGKNAYFFLSNEEVVLRGRPLSFIDENNMSYVCLIDAEMIEDFRRGALKPRYDAVQPVCPQGNVIARRDLFEGKGYLPISLLQFSRGCAHRCSFCASSVYFKAHHYCRPVPDVIREIQSQKRKLLRKTKMTHS